MKIPLFVLLLIAIKPIAITIIVTSVVTTVVSSVVTTAVTIMKTTTTMIQWVNIYVHSIPMVIFTIWNVFLQKSVTCCFVIS